MVIGKYGNNAHGNCDFMNGLFWSFRDFLSQK